MQSCPPLRRLLDEDNTGLNFPPYIVDRIGAIWFKHWQRHTDLKVVPEDDPSFACELPFDIASVALNDVLPGLRKHPFLLDRLLVRAIAFSILHFKIVDLMKQNRLRHMIHCTLWTGQLCACARQRFCSWPGFHPRARRMGRVSGALGSIRNTRTVCAWTELDCSNCNKARADARLRV